MKPCHACERHMLRTETECPFCGAEQSCAPAWPTACAWVLLVGALGAAACGPNVDDGQVAETSSTQGTTAGTAGDTTVDVTPGTSANPTIGTSEATTDATIDPTTADSSSSSNDDQGDSPGAFYAIAPDGGTSPLECDVWAQDCPKGEKCSPYSTQGDGTFDGSHCTPIAPDGPAVGEPCTAEGNGFSGIDDCEQGAMCFDVDEMNAGICVALCQGAPGNPLCEDPATACAVFNPNVFAVCLTSCDILMDECPEGDVCMTVGDVDVCVSDDG